VISLSSTPDVLQVLSRAAEIEVHAYTLHGPVKGALEAAARRGASVVVELERQPYKSSHLAAENARLVDEMRGAGVDAHLADPVHAKTIVADGTIYLDDKNWGARDLVLRADAADAASIPMIKHEALAAEAQLLRSAGDADAVVESESFGCCNAVYSALKGLARAGAAPRLLVSKDDLRGNASERRALDDLVRAGVRVRVCENSEKLAVAADRAWIGSANATIAAGPTDLPDWGFCTGDPAIVRALHDRIEGVWAGAKEFRG